MLLPVLCFLLNACNGIPSDPHNGKFISVDMLLSGEPLHRESDRPSAAPIPELDDVDILAVSAEMRDFLDFYVERSGAPEVRFRQLMSAFMNTQSVGLEYATKTRTAAETFATGEGNCLSFTNMFVAMARDIGLKADFQEVDVPPSWNHSGDTLVLNRHINIFVRTSNRGRGLPEMSETVDFNTTEARSDYDTRRISDRRAAAHYYSNIGVEFLQRGDNESAFRYFRKGLRTYEQFDALWINLGVLYSRLGDLDYARAAYEQALIHNRSMSALSSLARVYELMGNGPLAEHYREQVERYRNSNPYFRYFQAQEALEDKHYAQALRELAAAIELEPDEERFYLLRAVVHLRQGQNDMADSWFQQAIERTEDVRTRYRYQLKWRELLANPDIEVRSL